MKALLVTIVIVLALALIGWISFTDDDSRATIIIDKQEIKEDTLDVSRQLKDATHDAVNATREATRDAEAELEVPDTSHAPGP